mgnify:CR=1 FL=1
MEISVTVWGDLACFTSPTTKVERLSQAVPTPSAARGILSSVYAKPKEFFWMVTKIEVLKPIRYISVRRNEVKSILGNNMEPISAEDERTQRQTVFLYDVRYRITAQIVPRPDYHGTAEQLYAQAERRIKGGKCQPALGLRECVAYFSESDPNEKPIQQDMDLGLMVYDIFDLHDAEVRKKTRTRLSLYHAVMKQGVIEVPPYDSPEVLKGDAIC